MQNISIKSVNYIKNKLVTINSLLNQKKIIIPFLLTFLYLLLYFIQDFSSQSLIAHDEGLYARRSRLVEESSNWFSSPFTKPHHKTIGSYWFIALSIRLFGNSELALRLPSIFFSFLCLILTYLIALKITNKKSALISVLSLSSMPIWIQYSRYASPDFPYLFCILLVILSFLNFLDSNYYIRKYFYIFLSGSFISFAFFIRSYMVFVPLLGLIPFIWFHLFRSKKRFSFLFITGIFFGSIPTLVNLSLSYRQFGLKGISALFEFAKNQAISGVLFEHSLYIPFQFIYLTFPVGIIFFTLIVFTRPQSTIKYPLLTYYYPFLSLSILLFMSTTYPHYYLILLPQFSIIFANNIQSYKFRFSNSKISISYLFLSLVIIIIFLLITLLIYYQFYLIDYPHRHSTIVYLSIFLLIISFLFSLRFLFDFGNRPFNLLNFFFTVILSQYISISMLYNFGVIGSPNLSVKSFLNNSLVASISNSNTIYIFNADSKIQTLLSYYLPSSKILKSSNDIFMYNYIITGDQDLVYSGEMKSSFRIINTFKNHFLLMNIGK